MTKIFNTVLENSNVLGINVGTDPKTVAEIIDFFRKQIKEEIKRKIHQDKQEKTEKQLEDQLNWLKNQLEIFGDNIQVSIEIELDTKGVVNIGIKPKK